LGRSQDDNVAGRDALKSGPEQLKSLSQLSLDLLDGMTLEEERGMLRWSLGAVHALSERDMERTAEIDAHLRRINEVEEALDESERNSQEAFEAIREHIKTKIRVQEQNTKQDTLKIEQAMVEKLSELNAAIAAQRGELNFKVTMLEAHLHDIEEMHTVSIETRIPPTTTTPTTDHSNKELCATKTATSPRSSLSKFLRTR